MQKIPIFFGQAIYSGTGWNPAYKGTGITLSNFDRDCNFGASGTFRITRTVRYIPTGGKYYVELKVVSGVAGGGATMWIGIDGGSTGINAQLGVASTSCCYQETSGFGQIIINNTVAQTSLATFATGDVIGMAVDTTGNTVQFYKNNVAVGTAQAIPGSTNYYVAVGASTFAVMVARGIFDSSTTYTPPAGFTAGIP